MHVVRWFLGVVLVVGSPFDPTPLPRSGPYFDGWFTRIIDATANRSFSFILGSYQAEGATAYTQTWAVAIVSHANGTVETENVFPDEGSVHITRHGGLRGAPAHFEVSSSLGTLTVQNSTSQLKLSFPSGLSFSAELHGRVPWNPTCPDSCGPEGWARHLPAPLLPTTYYVHSLASEAVYTLNGVQGRGFAHQEGNAGARFPVGWIWVQGVTADGKSQVVLTGGEFTIAGITVRQFILGYRSRDVQWDFRNIDLDHIDVDVNSCNTSIGLSAHSALGERKVDMFVSAPRDTFSEPLYFPTPTGFSNDPGCVESYRAKATIEVQEKFHGFKELAEMEQVALEFGGNYRCSAEVETTTPEVAFFA